MASDFFMVDKNMVRVFGAEGAVFLTAIMDHIQSEHIYRSMEVDRSKDPFYVGVFYDLGSGKAIWPRVIPGGYVRFLQTDITRVTMLSSNKQVNFVKKYKAAGFLSVYRKFSPPAYYYKVDEDGLASFVKKEIQRMEKGRVR